MIQRTLFTADNGPDGRGLYITDGTQGGTRLLRDIFPGLANPSFLSSSNPTFGNFIQFGENLLFVSDDGESDSELWISDGTTEGTLQLTNFDPGDQGSMGEFLNSFTLLGEQVFFNAGRFQRLWVTDGTPEGTRQVNHTNGEAVDTLFLDIVALGDNILFTRASKSLWISDGTDAGTFKIADIPRPGNNFDFGLTVLGDVVIFGTSNGESGTALWVTDGTEEGTRLLQEFGFELNESGSTIDSSPRHFINVGEVVLFSAHGHLWVTDGTEDGTLLLRQNVSSPNIGFPPQNYVIIDNQIIFRHADTIIVSDGTVNGTVEILDEIRFPDSPVFVDVAFVAINDKAVFSGRRFIDEQEISGLWITDGTIEGTSLLFQVRGFFDFTILASNGSQIIFSDIFQNVYVTDGTEEGTTTVIQGASTVFVNRFHFEVEVSVDNKFIINYFKNEFGTESYITDGTVEGTVRLDIPDQNTESSRIETIEVEGDNLFFTASDDFFTSTIFAYSESLNLERILPIEFDDLSLNDPEDLSFLGNKVIFSGRVKDGSDSVLGLYSYDRDSENVDILTN